MRIPQTQKAASEVHRSGLVVDGDYEQQQVVFDQELTECSSIHFAIHFQQHADVVLYNCLQSLSTVSEYTVKLSSCV